ncbi:MAG: winged helix-turn-helix transcriptional regulator [Oscillospiraceae bacterium]|nr:winged helix-turn-helix transcriptional regulator [Oscillospiraceae bacterium]
MIDRFEKFSYFISEISHHWHKIANDVMNEYGLKGPHSVYFTTLYQYPDGITATRLGEICSRDKADVSRAVSLMEKKGLVIKEGSNYRALLKLTKDGEKIAEQIKSQAEAAVEYGGKGLTDEQRTIFYEAIEIICDNLEDLSKKGF